MTPRKNPSFSFRAGVIAGILAALVIGGYTLYATLPYLLGPSLKVFETTQNGETVVTGVTARVSYLSIDGMNVPLQEDGSFSVQRAYPLGYTAITISAKDRFSRTITKTITFLNK